VSRATATGRPPGRPRSGAADQAILDAALAVFAESGLDGLTVEGVAARAGVGKATIYRRYPCKVDLVIAAARALTDAEVPKPDTGSVDGDLRAIVRNLVRLVTTTVAGRAVPQLVAEAERNDEMRQAHSQFIAGRRAGTMDALRSGIERGELRPDTDVDLVAEMATAPIFFRHLVSGRPLDARFADRVVAAALAPWRSRSS
jgi:AcrR family transcriptional regulator